MLDQNDKNVQMLFFLRNVQMLHVFFPCMLLIDMAYVCMHVAADENMCACMCMLLMKTRPLLKLPWTHLPWPVASPSPGLDCMPACVKSELVLLCMLASGQ